MSSLLTFTYQSSFFLNLYSHEIKIQPKIPFKYGQIWPENKNLKLMKNVDLPEFFSKLQWKINNK